MVGRIVEVVFLLAAMLTGAVLAKTPLFDNLLIPAVLLIAGFWIYSKIKK